MIEIDLVRLQKCLIWQLRALAAIRRMCEGEAIDLAWSEVQEREVAKLHEQLRKLRKARGDMLVVVL